MHVGRYFIGSGGLLSVIAATGVHIKSINVQEVLIQRSFSKYFIVFV